MYLKKKYPYKITAHYEYGKSLWQFCLVARGNKKVKNKCATLCSKRKDGTKNKNN